LKWPRNLTPDEWKKAKEVNKFNFNLFKKIKLFFCKKRRASVVTPQRNSTQNTIVYLNENG
jgi:hypothetical protein